MSAFRAYFAKNIRSEQVYEFTGDAVAVWLTGDLVYQDTSTDTLKKCGADPALIAGLAENPSTYNYTESSKVPIRLIHQDDVIAMSSATDYADTMIGNTVDISDATGGIWKVLTSTSAPRVTIVGGVPAANSLYGAIYFVQFIAANLQFDAVAS